MIWLYVLHLFSEADGTDDAQVFLEKCWYGSSLLKNKEMGIYLLRNVKQQNLWKYKNNKICWDKSRKEEFYGVKKPINLWDVVNNIIKSEPVQE